MKKALLLGLALMLVSSVAFASEGYIGLFVDAGHTSWCITNPGGFLPFTMYVWCLPGSLGQICAEFMVTYPPNCIQSTISANDPIISVTLGTLPTGMSVCYIECQYAWHWNFQQIIYSTDTAAGVFEIVAHPDAGAYQFANCTPGYPIEPCIKLTNLYMNGVCGPTAVESTSWGAIKGLFE